MPNSLRSRALLGATFGAAVAAGAGAASAETLRISIENLQGEGGFSLTPAYTAFHDGAFDAFDAGEAASPGVELLAELGDSSGLPGERTAVDPESVATMITAETSGPPTIDAGETGVAELEVISDGVERRYMTFLSMIVPTNDQFVGNDDPLAFEVFDADGNFNGTQVIDVTAAFAHDAGTEVNDPEDGPAFVVGVDAAAGTDEGGVVTQAQFGLDPFLGLETPAGTVDAPLDVVGDPAGTQIARITVEAVPAPIPVPAAAPLLLTAMGGLVVLRRRRTA